MRAEAEANGAPPEYIAQLDELANGGDGDCVVWPENWESVIMFLGLHSCWRKQYLDMAGQIVWEGFYWSDVTALLREMQPKRKQRRALIEDLRIMESAALEALNQPTKKQDM